MGRRFIYARRFLKLNQTDLAAMLGVSQDHISRIETGKKVLSRFSAERFKSVFGEAANFVAFGTNPERYKYELGATPQFKYGIYKSR